MNKLHEGDFLRKLKDKVLNAIGFGDPMVTRRTPADKKPWKGGHTNAGVVRGINKQTRTVNPTLPPEAKPPSTAKAFPSTVGRDVGKGGSYSGALGGQKKETPAPTSTSKRLHVGKTDAEKETDASEMDARINHFFNTVHGTASSKRGYSTNNGDTEIKQASAAQSVNRTGVRIRDNGPSTRVKWYSTNKNTAAKPGPTSATAKLIGKTLAGALYVPRISKLKKKVDGKSVPTGEMSHYLAPEELGTRGQLPHEAQARQSFMDKKNAQIKTHNEPLEAAAAAKGPVKSGKRKGQSRKVVGARPYLTQGDVSPTLNTIRTVLAEANWMGHTYRVRNKKRKAKHEPKAD